MGSPTLLSMTPIPLTTKSPQGPSKVHKLLTPLPIPKQYATLPFQPPRVSGNSLVCLTTDQYSGDPLPNTKPPRITQIQGHTH
ncbi:hypothetical protein G9A89_000344 [Geosiphon pyriformis]|nr:hypothetical protein G9A89_000344 [Geosiphon pyriformis]